MSKTIELGTVARDRITGFEGRVTGYCEYITGCNQALLAAPAKDGKLGEANWFDVQRLETTDKFPLKLDNSETPGCDSPAPIR